MTMTFKTFAVVGAAIIAELLFCVLFLASLSMASARWTSGSPVTHRTESGTPSTADPVATATPSPGPSPTSSPQPSRTDLVQKIDSMRDMHSRISGAGTPEALAALLPSMDRLMHEGLVLMRAMKPGLPASETGEVVSAELTVQQAESVQDFLELMEALIVMKGDRDSALKGNAGSGPAPRTREGPTAVGSKLVRMQTHQLTGLVMSI